MLRSWTNITTELKERAIVARDTSIAKERFLQSDKPEDHAFANALEIEIIDFAKETKGLLAQKTKLFEVNQKMSIELNKLKNELPTLEGSKSQKMVAKIPELIENTLAIIPGAEEKIKNYDLMKPVPLTDSIIGFILGPKWVTQSYWHDWFGVIPLFTGSIMISSLALMVAVPFSIAAAIYVNQIASTTELNFIKPFIEFIEALPSIVLGFFGIAVLGEFLRWTSQQNFLAWVPGFPMPERLTILTAGLLLAFMAVPTIFTLVEDAINNVPKHFVEASYALGANRIQTVFKVLVPAALSGIIAAVLLGLGRVIGETMVVLLCAGNRIQVPDFSLGIGAYFQPAHTMTGIIAQEMGEVDQGSLHYRALFMVGVVLFFISLLLNFMAQQVVKKFKVKV